MHKSTSLLIFLSLLFVQFAFCQDIPNTVVINKQVELIEYDYDSILVELSSSINFSAYYPLINIGVPSQRQLFFEKGRNTRLGYNIGLQQSIKTGYWSLHTGLSYQLYSEFFIFNEYPIRNLTIQEMDGTLRTIEVADGDPVQFSRFNSLNYLMIPIGISFFPPQLKVKCGFTIQGNFHFLLSSDYVAKFSINEPVETVAGEYFNPLYSSLTGYITYQKKIARNNSLSLEPFFNMGLSNLIGIDDLTFGMNTIGLRTSFYFNH